MLLRQAEFLKLWVGQTISLVGSQVTQLALGLTAAAMLNATPAEMGILSTLSSVPFLLFGLVAGAWADRLRSIVERTAHKVVPLHREHKITAPHRRKRGSVT